ncbi:hypothetical protein PR048_015198 [Dryococelus australis]|uniref:Secreted protein n=1 Tax=Dryococelus australis TaxID=614101 RepID=A0ABQ9HGF5_9NEOP|nr:hypothetical protein PR048_015198 [Dryococelus australis]
MAPVWNRFYLLCLLLAASTREGTLYEKLCEDEGKFYNYFRMSTSTFDYILDRLVLTFSAKTQYHI